MVFIEGSVIVTLVPFLSSENSFLTTTSHTPLNFQGCHPIFCRLNEGGVGFRRKGKERESNRFSDEVWSVLNRYQNRVFRNKRPEVLLRPLQVCPVVGRSNLVGCCTLVSRERESGPTCGWVFFKFYLSSALCLSLRGSKADRPETSTSGLKNRVQTSSVENVDKVSYQRTKRDRDHLVSIEREHTAIAIKGVQEGVLVSKWCKLGFRNHVWRRWGVVKLSECGTVELLLDVLTTLDRISDTPLSSYLSQWRLFISL